MASEFSRFSPQRRGAENGKERRERKKTREVKKSNFTSICKNQSLQFSFSLRFSLFLLSGSAFRLLLVGILSLNAKEQRTQGSAEREKTRKAKVKFYIYMSIPVFAFLFISAILSFSSQRPLRFGS
jgi:membrane-anchored glycerophosphoryl diester phosphodiesterase (GDPDase)